MDAAHIATDKELERIEKKLTEIYKQASKELGEKADKYFERFKELDQQKRILVDAGKMTEADYRSWRQGKIMTGEHWKEMQKQAAQRLTEADRIAVEYTNGRLPYVYALNYNSVAEGLETRLNGYSFELVDEATVRNLAESDKTLLPYKIVDGKKAERWHAARVNAEVTQGILQGESIPKIAKRLRTNVGMTAKGSAVRNARTSVTSAENKGRIDMLHDARKKGVIVDKIWIAAHDSRTREAHLDLDGQQVPEDETFESMLGPIEYPGDPGADPANTYNCFLGEVKVASDSEIIRSYKHKYSGRIVTVETARGVKFSCTPNHPILTVNGWVSAESLHKGNDIIVTFAGNNVFGGVNPNVNHCFPRIDTIHELLYMMGGKRTVSMSVNFHGDIPTSNVEVVTKKRLLGRNWNAGSADCRNKFIFKSSDESLVSKRPLVKHFWGVWPSALGFISGACKLLPVVLRGLRHSKIHRLRPVALFNSGRIKPLNDDAARNAELLCECLDGFSGIIFADNIVSIKTNSGCSHVYNLQTQNGYYFVNSIIPQDRRKSNGIFAIAHNCRCSLGYKVVGFADRETGREERFGLYAKRRNE